MAKDAVLQSSLVLLAATVLAIGIYTGSLNKMIATYFLGMFGIAGILLPDWEYFDRQFSQWFSPVSVDSRNANSSARFKIYPIRLGVYTIVYGFALYKWWMFILS